MMNRRAFVCTAAAGVARIADAQRLRPMMDGVQPITAEERRARIEKARRLMRENKLGAIFIENGSSLFYFTGVRDPDLGLVLPARGEPVWIAQGATSAIPAGADVRIWRGPDGPSKE